MGKTASDRQVPVSVERVRQATLGLRCNCTHMKMDHSTLHNGPACFRCSDCLGYVQVVAK